MSGSGKDNSTNGGGDGGDFSQLKAKVIRMSLGWGVMLVKENACTYTTWQLFGAT